MMKNSHAYATAKKRDRESFPTRWLHQNGRLSGRVLDFGCGYGKDVEYMQQQDFSVVGYDPYYQPEWPEERFDTIICNYVLNVLLPEEQAEVMMAVSELLRPSGRAYFSVRRDLKKNGFRRHAIHKVDTYQCLVKLPYASVLRNRFCEIYEYLPFTRIDNGKAGLFENPGPTRELISELASVYSIYAPDPVSKGHALIIPKRKAETYFDCTAREQQALWLMAERVKDILETRYQPDGFKVYFTCGAAAGQKLPHAHIDMIPCYSFR
ncbi:MAG: HIT domain-containing protein [Cyclonatronaceae bacterium]